MASPAYLDKICGLETLADLKKVTLLLSALEPWQPWFESAGLDWIEPSSSLRLDDLCLMLEAVRHGCGAGLTRRHFPQHLIETGEIVQLFSCSMCIWSSCHMLIMLLTITVPESGQV